MNKEIITKNELKAMLEISNTTLYNWINKGYLRPLGIGRKIFFKYAEVMEALEQGYES